MPLSNQIEKYMEAEARKHRIPLNAKLELLPVCNLNCRMCYIRTDMETVRAQGGLLPVEAWLTLARELRDAGTLFLLLTGGEVFLYPGFEELYTQLIEMGFSITLNTNATLIDERVMSWLASARRSWSAFRSTARATRPMKCSAGRRTPLQKSIVRSICCSRIGFASS